MVSFAHTLLVVLGYVFIVAFSLFYLSMGIALARLASELKLMSAPERKMTERMLQPTWDDLTPEEQAVANKRLPVTIVTYIFIWFTYIGAAYFAVKFFFPGVISFFSNL